MPDILGMRDTTTFSPSSLLQRGRRPAERERSESNPNANLLHANGMNEEDRDDVEGSQRPGIQKWASAVHGNDQWSVHSPQDHNSAHCTANERCRVQTLAGSVEGFKDGQGTGAAMRRPSALCMDPLGYLVIADTGNHAVRRLSRSGSLVTVTKTLPAGEADLSSDEGSGAFRQPRGMISLKDGTLYVADCRSQWILEEKSDGSGLRIAAGAGRRGHLDGRGREALLNGPRGLAVTAEEEYLLIADSANYTIRSLRRKDGLVETVVGDGGRESKDGSLRGCSLAFPYGLCWDHSTNTLVVSEWEGHRIRRVDFATNQVTTVAGTGERGWCDGPALVATFDEPCFLCCDALGNVFVADSKNNAIRCVTTEGLVVTLLGTGNAAKEDGPVEQATLNRPWGVSFDVEGNLVVADGKNHAIRVLTEPHLALKAAVERFAQGGRGGARHRAVAGRGTQAGEATEAAHGTAAGESCERARTERPGSMGRSRSPTEELLARRYLEGGKGGREGVTVDREEARRPGRGGAGGGADEVEMTLTLGEKFLCSDSKRAWLEKTVVEDIALAVAAPANRFKVASVRQGSRDCLLITLRVFAAAGGAHVHSAAHVSPLGCLSPLQLAQEIQRQVADPLSPLRQSSSMQRVMHAHLQDWCLRDLPAPSPPASYGAPPALTLSTAAPAPPPLLSSNPPLNFQQRSPSVAPEGSGSKPPSPEEVPILEDLTKRLFEGMTESPSSPDPSHLPPHSTPPAPPQASASRSGGFLAWSPQQHVQHHANQPVPTQAVWMPSDGTSGASSPLSVQSASSRAHDSDHENNPLAPPSPSSPRDFGCAGHHARHEGLVASAARTIWTSPPSTQSSLGLCTMGDLGSEASSTSSEALLRLRAAERNLEESERSRRELRDSAKKQGEYIVALKGLSIAQAREVEALAAKNEVLNTQLRELRKKGKEQAVKRKEMKGLRLSESFGLEQQLQAERNRNKEITAHYEQLLREGHEREQALFSARSHDGGKEEGGISDEAARLLLQRVADLEMQLLVAKGLAAPDTPI